MAEPAVSRRPPPLQYGPLLRPLPSVARFSLRGGPQVLAAAGRALGLELRTQACRSVQNDGRAALWLGPDEQLLLVPEAQAASIAALLQPALSDMRHSLVDVSHRQLALQLEGNAAASTLNVGCPLDLDPEVFQVGMCTRTVLGKAEIVLWRTAPQAFHLEVWRSFAPYLVSFLNEAMRELCC